MSAFPASAGYYDLLYHDKNYAIGAEHVAGLLRHYAPERDKMRYLFTPEVELMLAANDVTLVDSREWMSARKPGFDSWNACYIAHG